VSLPLAYARPSTPSSIGRKDVDGRHRRQVYAACAGQTATAGHDEVTLRRSFDGSFAAAQDAAQDIGNGTVFAARKRQSAKT
jgi:hypothetical protein